MHTWPYWYKASLISFLLIKAILGADYGPEPSTDSSPIRWLCFSLGLLHLACMKRSVSHLILYCLSMYFQPPPPPIQSLEKFMLMISQFTIPWRQGAKEGKCDSFSRTSKVYTLQAGKHFQTMQNMGFKISLLTPILRSTGLATHESSFARQVCGF